jgi:hypothetical protein
MNLTHEGLCYVEASKVMGPTGDLAELEIRSMTDEQLGSLDGVLIDPTEGRLRYFVIERPGWRKPRRCLFPLAVAHVERDAKTLRLDVEPAELSRCEEFDATIITRAALVPDRCATLDAPAPSRQDRRSSAR